MKTVWSQPPVWQWRWMQSHMPHPRLPHEVTVRPPVSSSSQIQWACYKKWKVEWEAQTVMCQCPTSTFKNSCGCTVLDTPEWREMTEQTDCMAKQPSQVACISEDLKCQGAWETTCGHKAKDMTQLTAWRDVWKEEALNDLPSDSKKRPLPIRQMMKQFQQWQWGNFWATGSSTYIWGFLSAQVSSSSELNCANTVFWLHLWAHPVIDNNNQILIQPPPPPPPKSLWKMHFNASGYWWQKTTTNLFGAYNSSTKPNPFSSAFSLSLPIIPQTLTHSEDNSDLEKGTGSESKKTQGDNQAYVSALYTQHA